MQGKVSLQQVGECIVKQLILLKEVGAEVLVVAKLLLPFLVPISLMQPVPKLTVVMAAYIKLLLQEVAGGTVSHMGQAKSGLL